ncbi:type II toxin-antitoxin system VapC family toxin [uncultured Hoeflea sp.]|uniref:type II toxin-antitoxin system VapC family toxin n=1 Tax=uncultured Hoeflea sp. TaxID=538666 RepID=UPI0030DBEEE0|tara:strand:+ start:1810 stop:2244 length:435 start_codon:yes stop_codon:yes gene_type:complete
MANGQRVYLDTNALIGILETSDELDRAQDLLVQEISSGELEAATSELALAECLIKPITDRDEALVRDYLRLLASDSTFLRVIPVTREIILEAARVRAGTRIKLPDAIHLATAKIGQCQAFVSNDKRLASATAMPFRLWSEMGTP